MPLINYKINLVLDQLSANCVIISSADAGTFAITETKLYVAVVTLSTEVNVKLLKQLESAFKRGVILNKYQ